MLVEEVTVEEVTVEEVTVEEVTVEEVTCRGGHGPPNPGHVEVTSPEVGGHVEEEVTGHPAQVTCRGGRRPGGRRSRRGGGHGPPSPGHL